MNRTLLALGLLALFAPLVLFGIDYVPRHDGTVIETLLVVILPAAGACWCLAQLLPRPSQGK